MKKTLLLLAAGLMVLAIVIGCSKEDPWSTTGARPLELLIVSAPDTSTAIPDNSSVSFSWTAKGGSSRITGYQWYLSPVESAYGTSAVTTSTTYKNLAGDSAGTDYTFNIRVTDNAANTATTTIEFTVSAAVAATPDITAPTVAISEATKTRYEGAYAATSNPVAFSWTGDDGKGNLDVIEYQYIHTPSNDTSDWLPGTSVSFTGADMPATDPAVFYVRGRDPDTNVSAWDSIAYTVKDASILYIDDYQWLTGTGAVDNNKERDQKQFYRTCLEGYAFAEWDNDAEDSLPSAATLANYDVVIWCADSDAGAADPNYRLWYDIGAAGGGVLKDFIDGGGKLLLTGSETFPYMYNSNGPQPTDFEAAYLGVRADDESIDEIDTTWWLDGEPYDTLVTSPDSLTADTSYMASWQNYYFSWAIGIAEGYPDSFIIDIAKNGDQYAYANSLITDGIDTTWWRNGVAHDTLTDWNDSVVVDTTFYLNEDVIPIYTVGLVLGDPYGNFGQTCGWIYAPGGTPISAVLGFDTYSMPVLDIKETFQAILDEFGE